MLSFYLISLLCITGLVASAPITTTHRRHLDSQRSSSFPYGKLADRLLNVNDDVSYTMDDLDEDMIRVYPENHTISSAIPIANLEPKLSLPTTRSRVRNVGTKNLFYRIPDIVRNIVIQKWDTAVLDRWRTMARDQS
jgi:hypothetical protein